MKITVQKTTTDEIEITCPAYYRETRTVLTEYYKIHEDGRVENLIMWDNGFFNVSEYIAADINKIVNTYEKITEEDWLSVVNLAIEKIAFNNNLKK